MVEARFAPEITSADPGRRITIPQRYCERLPWIRGGETLSVWLLMLLPGRFRLLSDPEVEKDPRLREIRSVIVGGPEVSDTPPSVFEPSEQAASIGRLIPATLAPPGPSWRLTLPKQISIEDENRRRVVLMFSMGYMEIWFLDIYNAAIAAPLDSAI
jgi:hypothetical protein